MKQIKLLLLSFLALSMLFGLSIQSSGSSSTVNLTDSKDSDILQGSYVQVVSGQVYRYSLTSSGSGRYDEFYITTSGASLLTVTMEFDFSSGIESNDDFDLYYRAGSRVSSCSSTTCSGYTSVSWNGGNAAEQIDVNSPANGQHHFRVQRYSGSGTEYYFFTVTVSGAGGGDTTAPTITVTSPSNGATVSGTTAVTATASDNVGVTSVEFRVDGALKATDSSSPYSFNWDTTTASNGAHTVSATAFDAAGNSGSNSISVTVSNSGPPPTGCGETPRVTGSYPFWNDAIDVEKAHAANCYGGDSVVVILDTGLGSGYASLFPTGSILSQYSRSYTQLGGYDNVNWNQDTEGHGTSTTSTVLGYYVPSTWGFTNNYAMGVAPNADVVMLRVVFWVGSGVTYAQMIQSWVDAITYARSLHGNQLAGRGMTISMSLGYTPSAAPASSNTALENAINSARADGIAVSVSAGNDGPGSNTTGNPANFDSSTSVAAAGWSGLTGSYGVAGILTDLPEDNFSGLTIADFSSRGKVEITAMGWQLVLPSFDNNYYYISGTSFSCPQVSGVYAIMFGYYGASTSVNFLESTMQNTAYFLSPATTWGAGFVQVDATIGL
jgi:hypothetical protein